MSFTLKQMQELLPGVDFTGYEEPFTIGTTDQSTPTTTKQSEAPGKPSSDSQPGREGSQEAKTVGRNEPPVL